MMECRGQKKKKKDRCPVGVAQRTLLESIHLLFVPLVQPLPKVMVLVISYFLKTWFLWLEQQ